MPKTFPGSVSGPLLFMISKDLTVKDRPVTVAIPKEFMAFLRTIPVSLAAVSAISPLAAQSALDRVDPARVEERAQEAPPALDGQVAVALEPKDAAADGPRIAVGAIDLAGLRALPRSDFADIIEAYVGRSLSGDELAELADRLARRARETYPLASAIIEDQTLRAGVLRVRIDEGTVDEVVLEGTTNAAVMATVRPLATGRPVTRAEFDRHLLLADDIDGVSLGKVRVERREGRNVLLVPVSYSRFSAQVSIDNDSTRPLGPHELIASGRASGVLDDDDSLQALVLNAVPDLEELTFARLRYANRISAAGTILTLTGSISNTMPGAYLAPLDIHGQGWFASAGLQHPLVRSRRTNLWIDAAIGYRALEQDRAGVIARRDRLTTMQVGVFGNAALAGGNLRAAATVSRGLDLLGATGFGDPLSSREDADGTFTKVQLSAEWRGRLVGAFGAHVALRSQLASQPLLVAEELGVGGAQFVRGYDYSERTGDEGALGYLELSYTHDKTLGPIDGFELYAFADGGEAINLADGFGGGTLFSSGGGIRLDVDRRTDAGLELAVPLSGDRYETDDQGPRVRFSITRYF